jgi:hypothetical protein
VSEPGRIVAWDVPLSVSCERVAACAGSGERPEIPAPAITKPAQPRAGYLLYRTAQTDVVGF